MIHRPMLSASAADFASLVKHWPGTVLASPKLDGIRCLIHPEHGAVSRNFKPIRNRVIRETFNRSLKKFVGLDGELVTFSNGEVNDYNTIQSEVMSEEGSPHFALLVFDDFTIPNATFSSRLLSAQRRVEYLHSVRMVPHAHIHTPSAFVEYANLCLQEGHEGAMYRHPEGMYKNGRSTLIQGWLVKWKNVEDDEGIVVGFEERLHNANPAERNALGLTERSSHKANMVGAKTLGKLYVETKKWGVISVGSGFTDIERLHIWRNQEKYKGRMLTFKYQPEGMKDAPRFPIFKGWRDDL